MARGRVEQGVMRRLTKVEAELLGVPNSWHVANNGSHYELLKSDGRKQLARVPMTDAQKAEAKTRLDRFWGTQERGLYVPGAGDSVDEISRLKQALRIVLAAPGVAADVRGFVRGVLGE